MKRNRENFNKNDFSNSRGYKETKPNYGSDSKKIARIEEINNELKFSKVMSPFDVKKIKEKIIKMVKAKFYIGLYMELSTSEECEFRFRNPSDAFMGEAPTIPNRYEYANTTEYEYALKEYDMEFQEYNVRSSDRRKEWLREYHKYSDDLVKLKAETETNFIETTLIDHLTRDRQLIIERDSTSSGLEYLEVIEKQIKGTLKWDDKTESVKMFKCIKQLKVRDEGDVRIWINTIKEMIQEYIEKMADINVKSIPGLKRNQRLTRVGEQELVGRGTVDRGNDLTQATYDEFKTYGCSSSAIENLRLKEKTEAVKDGKSPFLHFSSKAGRGFFAMIEYMEELIDKMEEQETEATRLWFGPIYNGRRNISSAGKEKDNSIELAVNTVKSNSATSGSNPRDSATSGRSSATSGSSSATSGSNNSGFPNNNHGTSSGRSDSGNRDGMTRDNSQECVYCIGIGKTGKAVKHLDDRCYSNPQSPAYRSPYYGPERGTGRANSRGGRSGNSGRHRGYHKSNSK